MKRKRDTYPTWYHLYTQDDSIKRYTASLLANIHLQKVENAEYAVYDMIQQEGRLQLKKTNSNTKQQHMLQIPLPSTHEYVITCNLYECHNLNTSSFVSNIIILKESATSLDVFDLNAAIIDGTVVRKRIIFRRFPSFMLVIYSSSSCFTSFVGSIETMYVPYIC